MLRKGKEEKQEAGDVFGLARKQVGCLTTCKGVRQCPILAEKKTETKRVKDKDEQKYASCNLLPEAYSTNGLCCHQEWKGGALGGLIVIKTKSARIPTAPT